MLQLINDLPDFVVGIKASGEVSKEDLETVLVPAIDRQVAQYDAIYYLLLLETDIKNWDFGAWISDAKIGLKYLTKWEKIAVVTEQESVQKFTDIFSKLAPGEARGYALNELETAKAWVSERVVS
jgi:hypothetical protein